ncbi:hypothetical protein FZEAL_1652 [Fusarium zealandicum]|uniref:Metalloprotease n=1 Tax=Fusarium zealandicum TaxID=1053134 RepID=A0A8H4XPP9_9HYPO|nr:hypothetical protein FZEAL_1652 [Fusarium zealandicum]
MRPSLIVGLFAGLGSAANINIWDVDSSCDPHIAALQKAYDDAADMASKAQRDLRFVQQARPKYSRTRANINEIREWDRIARAVTNMFGFEVNKAGHDPNDPDMADVLYVFDRMNTALQGNQNVPQGGYSGQHQQALLMCDTTPWDWIGRNDPDPLNPGLSLVASKPQDLGTGPGAWYYKERYISNGNPNSISICRPGVFAVTMTRWDLLTFCPFSFQGNLPGTIGPVDGRAGAAVGNTLDQYGAFSLSRVMIHELAHWYGAGGRGTDNDRKVTDKQAVGKNGDLIWYNTQTKKYQTAKDDGVLKATAYAYSWVSKLAKINQPPNDANSGPRQAIFNAESYAYFGMMAYMDSFDWADDGKAKDIQNPLVPSNP